VAFVCQESDELLMHGTFTASKADYQLVVPFQASAIPNQMDQQQEAPSKLSCLAKSGTKAKIIKTQIDFPSAKLPLILFIFSKLSV
jgi:hypothetical protein